MSHTKNADVGIAEELDIAAEFLKGVETQKELMSELIQIPADTNTIHDFLEEAFPTDTKSKRVNTQNLERKKEIRGLVTAYECELEPPADTSFYALTQAITQWVDMERKRNHRHWTYRRWDGLTGDRAKLKDKLFGGLVEFLREKKLLAG